jgi:hypothetical protein
MAANLCLNVFFYLTTTISFSRFECLIEPASNGIRKRKMLLYRTHPDNPP